MSKAIRWQRGFGDESAETNSDRCPCARLAGTERLLRHPVTAQRTEHPHADRYGDRQAQPQQAQHDEAQHDEAHDRSANGQATV
jgi:hypothetical protein